MIVESMPAPLATKAFYACADLVNTSKFPLAKITCAVKGPMVVIRARPDGMGLKFVNVLKSYLKYTSSRHNPWQQQPCKEGLPCWQLFEVVGDLGESDKIELHEKLSSWARLR